MRIKVTGDSRSAIALRGLIQAAGLLLTDDSPHYAFFLEEGREVYATVNGERFDCIVVDSIDSPLERQVINCIAELTSTPLLLLRAAGSIQTDREMKIIVPPNERDTVAVENGVLRGLGLAASVEIKEHFESKKPKRRRFFGFITLFLLLAFLLSTHTSAQTVLTKKDEPRAELTAPALPADTRLALRDLQFQQDKLLLRLEALRLEEQKLETEINLYSDRITALARNLMRALKLDEADWLLDLDLLQFTLRKGVKR